MDKWIIFDFDGTLADTVDAGIDTINFFAKRYGFRPVSKEDYPRLRDLSSREMLKAVGVSLWKLPFLARSVRKKFAAEIPKQKLFFGITSVLTQMKQQGYHLAILTTNSEANIAAFSVQNNLKDLFELVHAEKGLFNKGRRLKKLLRKHRIDARKTIYVGDETRDIDAAREAGVKSMAVTWGVNSKAVLQAHHPDFLIDKPEQLLEIFKKTE